MCISSLKCISKVYQVYINTIWQVFLFWALRLTLGHGFLNNFLIDLKSLSWSSCDSQVDECLELEQGSRETVTFN